MITSLIRFLMDDKTIFIGLIIVIVISLIMTSFIWRFIWSSKITKGTQIYMKNYLLPLLILCFSSCLSLWCIINVIMTPILSIMWLMMDVIYLPCLFVMIIVTVVAFLYYLTKRKENIVKERCFKLSKISLILVLGNIVLLILYITTIFILSYFISPDIIIFIIISLELIIIIISIIKWKKIRIILEIGESLISKLFKM